MRDPHGAAGRRRARFCLRFLAALPVWCAGFAPAHAQHLGEVTARGTLRVLVAADEQPEMFSIANRANPGVEREMIETFARIHGLRLQIVAVENFDEMIPRLVGGEGDVIVGISDTLARRNRIAFSREVLPSRHVAVSRRPHRAVQTVEMLREERVGVVRATSWADSVAAAGVPPDRLTTYTSLADVLAALGAGRITATVTSFLDFTLLARHDRRLQAGLLLGTPSSAAWGVRQEDTALRAALDHHLDGMKKGGAWSRLVVKYFGDKALDVLGRAHKP